MKKLILIILFIYPIGGAFSQNFDVVGNINTKGNIQINGNPGTTGQVLMSKGNASPEWTTLSNNMAAVGGKFSIVQTAVSSQTNQVGNTFSNALNASTSQLGLVDFYSTDYNTNSDITIDLANDLITVNRTGLYHFEGLIKFFVNSSQTQIPVAAISYKINNDIAYNIDEEILVATTATLYQKSIPLRLDKYLIAGQTLKFIARINNLDTNPALIGIGIFPGSFISGYFMSE